MADHITLKRVYDSVTDADGVRVLVDRLWPRGIAKTDERINKWYQDIAPSHDLRKWFHESGDFVTFSKKYRQELEESEAARAALQTLRKLVAQSERVTLVFASKEEQQNNAVVLKQVLEGKSQSSK